MRTGLWAVYMQLQTELAYGNSIGNSPPSEHQATYLDLPKDRDLVGSLVIGPGGPNELNALSHLPKPISAMTAHRPELEIIKANVPDVLVSLGDIHDMPYANGAFQFVYASNVLEHCFSPYIALMECRRVLQSGGIAHLVLPSFAGREGGRGPFHLHCLTEEVWTELLRKVGFTVVTSVVPGGEDPDAHYVHYKCTAVELSWPHNEILSRVTALKNAQ